MSKKQQQQYTSNAYVIAGLVVATMAMAATALASSNAILIPSAFADDRFPQPQWHCQGNPHSDEPTHNPHDPGLNDKSNPHDDKECTINPNSPK
jgi:hypothetical protein